MWIITSRLSINRLPKGSYVAEQEIESNSVKSENSLSENWTLRICM